MDEPHIPNLLPRILAHWHAPRLRLARCVDIHLVCRQAPAKRSHPTRAPGRRAERAVAGCGHGEGTREGGQRRGGRSGQGVGGQACGYLEDIVPRRIEVG